MSGDSAPAGLRVSGFDHLVLRVADVERSLTWYIGTLALEPVRVEEWRRGEVPFPSVRIDAATIIDLVPEAPGIPLATGAARTLDHLCLVIEPTDLHDLAGRTDLRVVDGPAARFGARGTGQSLYVLDPDDNVVELRHY